MKKEENEEQLLREVTLQNAQSIFLARQRAEEELVRTKEELWKQSEWLRVTLASIGDAVVTTDIEGKVLSLNSVAEGLTGWTQQEAQGYPLSEVFRIINEETRQPVENPAERALREGRVVGLANHTILIAKDGTETPIDDSAAPIRDEHGRMHGVVLIFRSIAERKQAEQRLATQYQITQIMAESASLNDAAPKILQVICQHLKWRVGALWRVDERSQCIRCVEVYHLPDNVAPHFEADCQKRVFAPGIGLPGRVWASGQSAWIGDVSREKNFPRAAVAAAEGLHSAFCFPLRLNEEVLGVMEFFSEEIRQPDLELLEMMTAIGSQIGQFIERKREEEARQEAERRYKAAFNQQFQFMAILALDGTVLEANETCFRATGVNPEHVLGQTLWNTPWWNQLPAMQQRWQQYIAEAGQGGGPITADMEYTMADGTLRQATVFVTGLRDDAGQISGIVVEGRDDTERKLYEQTLQASENRFRLLAEAIPAMVWICRPDGFLLYLNQRWVEYTGQRPEEYQGYGWAETMHPEDRERILAYWDHCTRTGASYEGECRYRRSDGVYRWHYFRGVPLRGEEGAITAWYGTSIDIEDKKVTEQALQEQAQQLRLALEAGRMGTWEWDIATNTVRWSSGLEALHGLAPGTFAGTFEAFQQATHPEDREFVLHSFAESLEQDKDHNVEYRIVLPAGGIRWVETRGKLFRDKIGAPARMLGVCSDITARKQAEQTTHFLADASAALTELTDYQSTLQRVAALAVPFFADWCAVDMLEPDGKVRRLAVTHTDPAKVQLAHELFRRYPPLPEDPRGLMQVLRTGAPDWVEIITDEMIVISARDEEHLRISRELGLKSYICVPLKSRTDVLGVLTFVTAESGRVYQADDLRAAQDLAHRAVIAIENANLLAALKESDRRKDEFLAILAHELRNPLAPVRNAVQILHAKSPPVPDLEWACNVIDRQVDQMTRLVDDLLDISRITRGKIELRKQRVELRSIINDAIEASRPLIEQWGHTLMIDLLPEPIWLEADPTRLTQVLLNLLNNAAKYTEPGGDIRITTECRDEQAIIRIKDNGIGIPREMLPRIFDMFTQVGHSIERSQGGLGIGLTLAQRLVALHGGEVEAKSQGTGQGSEFIVRLPVIQTVDRLVSPINAENEPRPASAALRILVVDDNQDSAESMAMFLRIIGHEVHTAHDGLAAVTAAEAFQPGVILLDIGLPKLNGYEVAHRIRAHRGNEVVLIALTGWGQEEDRRRSREAGFDHHLTKPVDFDKLSQLLTESNSHDF